MISFSPQQRAVFDWIESGQGSTVVVAVAGAGKTTTLVEALRRTDGTVAFAAYNRAIAAEIKARVEPLGLGNRVTVGTCHSFGLKAWNRHARGCRIDDKKMQGIADRLEVPDEFRTFALAASSMAKQTGIGAILPFTSREAWLAMVQHHDLDLHLPEDGGSEAEITGLRWACKLLKESIDQAYDVIDFDDMIYMPIVKGCRPWQHDWVLLDEAQDTNATRRALVRMMLKPDGRLIAVGDPAQAIYGFTGADSDAIANIRQEFGAGELPLTTTYRCPKAVVARAQEWVSHIQAAESAPEGETSTMALDLEKAAETFRPTDAILCRNTKPLVSLAYALIRKGIGCRVEGRAIGEGLLALANRWKVKSLATLDERLAAYLEKEQAKLIAKKREQAAENLADKVDTLRLIISSLPAGSGIADLRGKITALFSDTDDGRLTLCTIHRSKGREWHRVFWLDRPRYQPSRFARQGWQKQQEANLCYVAATRAKQSLIELSTKPEGEKA